MSVRHKLSDDRLTGPSNLVHKGPARSPAKRKQMLRLIKRAAFSAVVAARSNWLGLLG